MSRQPAVARWYQACFEHTPPYGDLTRYLAVVLTLGQLAEYWTGALEVTVEEICTRSGIGRNSAYEILRELEKHGLLLTRGRVAKGGPIRRQLAIQGCPPSIRTRIEQVSLGGDDRPAPPDSATDDRPGSGGVRTAAVQPGHWNVAPVSTGSSRGDRARRRHDPDGCPVCEYVPCLPDCRAASFRLTGSGTGTAPTTPAVAEAIAKARRTMRGAQ